MFYWIFLNELTIILNVKIINLFIDLIKNIGSTVIFNSYDLSMVEKLCDSIAIINEGKILKIWAQDEVNLLAGPRRVVENTFDKRSQELISGLIDHNFILENNERQNNIVVHKHKRIYYKVLLNELSNYEIIRIKEVEYSLEILSQ